MVRLLQFRYGSDNLGYLLYSENEAIIVDPGLTGIELKFLKVNKLGLKLIVNTHSHFDHTTGNKELQKLTGAGIADPETLISRGKLAIDNDDIEIIHTPGHTEDSICLKFDDNLITGDTLFIANIGNCAPVLLESFRKSLDKLLAMPDKTKFYPGHDYTERSIHRALSIEKSNAAIEDFYRNYSPPPVCSTIGTEKKINPYLRTNEPVIISHLEAMGKEVSTESQRFKSFLELY